MIMVVVSSDEISLEQFCHEELEDDHGGVNIDDYDDNEHDHDHRRYEHNPIRTSNLDIPPDNLEDIEFFPNFGDDLMSLPACLEITSFTPASDAAAGYQSLSPSVVDDIDYRDWYEFYSMNSVANTHDNLPDGRENKILDEVNCDNQSMVLAHDDQNHSTDRTTTATLDHELCDDQSMITYYQNHSIDQTASLDPQTKIFGEDNCDNQSIVISTYDDGQNHSPQSVEVCDNQRKTTTGSYNIAAIFYGIDESGGFQKKKMRSKRARRPPPPPRSTSGSSKRKCCTHCETESTPQWRMGPMGPNSLCNACGVRYQTGRLLPEYRPAASPTFDISKHSNFHKRILKKRKATMIIS